MKTKLRALGAAAALLMGASIPLAAHADEWKNVPHPLFFPNGTTVTAEMVQDSRGPLLDHCMSVAWETIPGRARTILGKAFTTGLAGGAGEATGVMGEAGVLGEHLAKNAVPAVGLLGFLANVFFGGFQGDAEVNSLFRSATDSCLARAGGGIYTMAPSEANAILATGTPHLVGVSRTWRLMHPPKDDAGHGEHVVPQKVLPGAVIDGPST